MKNRLNVITSKQICEKATKIMLGYINDGYIINAGTMKGCSNETFRVDLANSSETVRVMTSRVWSSRREEHAYMLLEVRKYDRGFEYRDRILWNDEGENIYAEKFYYLDEYGNRGKFLGSIEEIVEFNEKRYAVQEARFKRHTGNYHNANYRSISLDSSKAERIAKLCRKYHGYKRVKAEDIKSVERRVDRYSGAMYIIRFNRVIGKNAGDSMTITVR